MTGFRLRNPDRVPGPNRQNEEGLGAGQSACRADLSAVVENEGGRRTLPSSLFKKKDKGLTMSRKAAIIRDRDGERYMSISTVDKTLSRIYGMGRGKVFTPKDFLDLASHETVRQILSRMARKGKIRRLMRGVYEYPEFSKMLNSPAPPDADAIAHAIARAHGWTIVPSGDTALNMLGLSTQVPASWQYFSDGPTKQYSWQGGTLKLKHRAIKETAKLSPKTAMIVQALKTLGKSRADDSIVATLMQNLHKRDLSQALKETRYVTSWVYEIIRKMVERKDSSNA